MAASQKILASLERLLTGTVLSIARRYDYAPQTISLRNKWKPVVLVIGNYSSGKSTLINELLGAPIQRTGQAPTDDCFTILVEADGASADGGPVEVDIEVPGSTIVNDGALPFSSFKPFGKSFVAHLVLKKVRAPTLHGLAIIDSPGMLDSVTEQDRGYDYQAVVGKFAELADLVVLVFDPHKAGTIKETYVSIRSTLPRATSEDRVVFVMNRIDECKNLTDLVRCYGGLCWNLSQMTGRKDIPRVFLTYSPELAVRNDPTLVELGDERSELLKKIADAPRLQVSHLLGNIDNHLHKLELIARAMGNASERYRAALTHYLQFGLVASVTSAIVLDTLVAVLLARQPEKGLLGRLFTGEHTVVMLLFPLVVFFAVALGFYLYYRRRWRGTFHEKLLAELDDCAVLESRYARDLWEAVRPKVRELLADRTSYGPFAGHAASAAKIRRIIDDDLRRLYEEHLRA